MVWLQKFSSDPDLNWTELNLLPATDEEFRYVATLSIGPTLHTAVACSSSHNLPQRSPICLSSPDVNANATDTFEMTPNIAWVISQTLMQDPKDYFPGYAALNSSRSMRSAVTESQEKEIFSLLSGAPGCSFFAANTIEGVPGEHLMSALQAAGVGSSSLLAKRGAIETVSKWGTKHSRFGKGCRSRSIVLLRLKGTEPRDSPRQADGSSRAKKTHRTSLHQPCGCLRFLNVRIQLREGFHGWHLNGFSVVEVRGFIEHCQACVPTSRILALRPCFLF